MTSITTKPDSSQPAAEMAVDLFDNWFDPIETEVRARAREFIEEPPRRVPCDPVYGQSRRASLALRPRTSAAPSIGPSESGFQQPDTRSAAAAHGPPSQ